MHKYKNTNTKYTNTAYDEVPEGPNMWYIFEKRIVQGYPGAPRAPGHDSKKGGCPDLRRLVVGVATSVSTHYSLKQYYVKCFIFKLYPYISGSNFHSALSPDFICPVFIAELKPSCTVV